VKVLILKPSSLGDVIHALPVLRQIKRHRPEAQVYWWIESGLAPLLEGDQDLAGVVRFYRRRWASPVNWGELIQSIRWMRAQRFDWVIDLQCLARSGAFAWLANGAFTVGLDEPREGARGLYDRIARRASFHTHAVDWYQAVLPLLDVPTTPDFEWIPRRAEVASGVERRWPEDGRRWVLLQPGARWLTKRWPLDYYREVVQKAQVRWPDIRFAVMGGAEDRDLGRAIVGPGGGGVLDLTAALTLPEMVEWIRRCTLMITNDTGPMHVAAALGKPVIGLFGPTEPRRTGPYGQLHRVLQAQTPCIPCLQSRCTYVHPLDCLRSLSPARVLQALEHELALSR